jgi:putative hemolysin
MPAQETSNTQPLIDIRDSVKNPFLKRLVQFFKPLIDFFLKITEINRIYDKDVRDTDKSQGFHTTLKAFDLTYSAVESEFTDIPKDGPLIMISNHPFGGADGVILMDMVLKQRKDVKILANEHLHRIPELGEQVIPVDVFSSNNKMANGRSIKRAIDWVKGGGALIIFPAGAVAHFQWNKLKYAEDQWHAHVGAMIRKSQATVMPVHIQGRNSWLYQCLGSFSVTLRSMMLARELVNKKSKHYNLMLGRPMPWKKLEGFEDDGKLISYLKDTVEFMQKRRVEQEEEKLLEVKNNMQEIIPAIDPELLALEVQALPACSHLIRRQEMSVYVAKAEEMPHVMQELGRLREISYRGVEEGSGLSCDIDSFDEYYLHLFVWNHETSEVVGAYRMGLVDKILEEKGKKGLYTNMLFKYKRPFIEHIRDSIELGRSFIRPEYQEAFGVLPLMWKGICLYMLQHPNYRKLFGGVSISNGYKKRSRNLMIRFLKTHKCDPFLTPYVNARTPYRSKKTHRSVKHMVKKSARDMNDISLAISSVEKDNKGIPVLIKHYLKLEASFLSFNVDKEFSDVVDGLILVDMDHSCERMIKHYMGPEGYKSYMSRPSLNAVAV